MAFADTVKFTAGSSGTSDFSDGTALTGFRSLSTGAVSGQTYSYRAFSADLSQWENGQGVYTSGSPGTLARTTQYLKTSTGSKVSFSTAPVVILTPLKADLDLLLTFALQTGLPVNCALAASVSGNALTISLKGNDGNDPSASNPVYIPFRSATATTGTQDVLTVTSATSLVISSGSTMGFANSTAGRIWVVAFNDSSTLRLGVVNARSGVNIMALRDNVLSSSTAEGGAGAADNAQTIYTGTAVTTKGMRILGYMDWGSGLATAGTWSSGPTLIQMFGPGVPKPGDLVQPIVRTDTGTVASGSTTVPLDNTIPQNTEGDQYMSQAITPTAAANLLRVTALGNYANSIATAIITQSLYQDTTANALAVTAGDEPVAGSPINISTNKVLLAGTTSSTTFKSRAGGNGGTTTFNGSSGNGLYNGTFNSFLEIAEIMG